jgi:hypothetical protein
MAPIMKTRRRAEAEVQELQQWFSGVLEDQSHFMRFENIAYPEYTFEELNADWDDELIDDEFHTGHQIWNWRKIQRLHQASNDDEFNRALLKMKDGPGGDGDRIVHNRWTEFRIIFPLVTFLTMALMVIPLLYDLFRGIFGGLSDWFTGAEKEYLDAEDKSGENNTKKENNSNIVEKTTNDDENDTLGINAEVDPSVTDGHINEPNNNSPNPRHNDKNKKISPNNHSKKTQNESDIAIKIQFSEPIQFIQQQDHNIKEQQHYFTKSMTNPQPFRMSQQDIQGGIQRHHFMTQDGDEGDEGDEDRHFHFS